MRGDPWITNRERDLAVKGESLGNPEEDRWTKASVADHAPAKVSLFTRNKPVQSNSRDATTISNLSRNRALLKRVRALQAMGK